MRYFDPVSQDRLKGETASQVKFRHLPPAQAVSNLGCIITALEAVSHIWENVVESKYVYA